MSGFDNLMKTDQHIAQNRQFYDAQRYQSDRATGEAIGKIPGQMQQAQMNQQAMEQQELQSALMEKQVDADMRAQEVVMEQQLHKNKMATALMFDEMAMSRLGVESAEVDLRGRKMALEKQELDSSTKTQTNTSQTVGTLLKEVGVHGIANMLNSKIEIGSDGNQKLTKFKDDKERGEYLKRNPRSGTEGVEVAREERLTRQGDASLDIERSKLALASQKAQADLAYKDFTASLAKSRLELDKSDSEGRQRIDKQKAEAEAEHRKKQDQFTKDKIKLDKNEASRREKEGKAGLILEAGEVDPWTKDSKYPTDVANRALEVIGHKPPKTTDTGSALTAVPPPTVDNVIDTYASRIMGDAFDEPQKRILSGVFIKHAKAIQDLYQLNMIGGRDAAKRTPEAFGQYFSAVLSDRDHPEFKGFVAILNVFKKR